MSHREPGLRLILLYCAILFFSELSGLYSQDLEPRAYSNIPVRMNFLLAGYAYSTGGVLFDPAVPLDIHHTLKFHISTGVSTRTGSDFDAVGLVWQYRWGQIMIR